MALFRFEHRSRALAPTHVFVGRVLWNLLAAIAIVAIALAAGMIGYHRIAGLEWIDAFLNAAMLLGGMGPVTPMESEAGKLFAGLYALTCGLVLVLVTGIVLAPVLHRVLHAMHLDAQP